MERRVEVFPFPLKMGRTPKRNGEEHRAKKHSVRRNGEERRSRSDEGTKKALLIGVNYRNTENELEGCIDDVLNIKELLVTKYGFNERDIWMLTDDTSTKPTKVNMLNAMRSLFLCGAETLYLHYSGHGTSIQCHEGTETDGLDECIVPIDFRQSGFIIDNDIKDLANQIPSTSTLVSVFDACHSGTAMDLRYTTTLGGSGPSIVVDRAHSRTDARIVYLSGCRDDQTSADAVEEGEHQGALTYAYLQVLRRDGYHPNYVELLKDVRVELRALGFTQIPQLAFGREENLGDTFPL